MNNHNKSILDRIYEGMPEEPDGTVEIAHVFGERHYARASVVPAGQTIRMHVHRHEHEAVIVTGFGVLVMDDAERFVRAGERIIVRAGVRHAYLAHEETIWLCVHPRGELEVETLYVQRPH